MFDLSSDIQIFHICQNNLSLLMFNWFHEHNKPKTEFNFPCLLYSLPVFTNSLVPLFTHLLRPRIQRSSQFVPSFSHLCASTISGQTIIIFHLNYFKDLLTSFSGTTILPSPFSLLSILQSKFFRMQSDIILQLRTILQ